MSECKSCALVAEFPNCGAVNANCEECAARSLAQSPVYFYAAQANAITPAYRDALQKEYGADWQEGHKKVRAWAEKLQGDK